MSTCWIVQPYWMSTCWMIDYRFFLSCKTVGCCPEMHVLASVLCFRLVQCHLPEVPFMCTCLCCAYNTSSHVGTSSTRFITSQGLHKKSPVHCTSCSVQLCFPTVSKQSTLLGLLVVPVNSKSLVLYYFLPTLLHLILSPYR